MMARSCSSGWLELHTCGIGRPTCEFEAPAADRACPGGPMWAGATACLPYVPERRSPHQRGTLRPGCWSRTGAWSTTPCNHTRLGYRIPVQYARTWTTHQPAPSYRVNNRGPVRVSDAGAHRPTKGERGSDRPADLGAGTVCDLTSRWSRKSGRAYVSD